VVPAIVDVEISKEPVGRKIILNFHPWIDDKTSDPRFIALAGFDVYSRFYAGAIRDSVGSAFLHAASRHGSCSAIAIDPSGDHRNPAS
jgi:hypothetical protein